MNKPQLLAGFAVKVLMGFLYGYIFLHYYNGDDTWKFFRTSLAETQLLLNDPGTFFRNEFTPDNALRTGTTTAEVIEVYLNDLQYALIVKLMAIFNLLSQGNYYINSIFFNAIFFFGHYWLFKLMSELFPAKRRTFFIIIFFFLPSVFWLSGIRVDGWLFFFLSMLFYYACTVSKPALVKRLALMVLGAIGTLICRPQVAALAGLALAGFIIAKRSRLKPAVAALTVYLFGILLFFGTAYISRGGGLPAFVAEKQAGFLKSNGTRFHLPQLDESPLSYIQAFPSAFANTFMRPLPWEAEGWLQLMSALEVAGFWLIIVACLYRAHRFWTLRLGHPVIVTMLFFGISIYIMTGYLVPFPGAIVRYKAIAELMILVAFISVSSIGEQTDYKKL
jgi:hypothetical protein